MKWDELVVQAECLLSHDSSILQITIWIFENDQPDDEGLKSMQAKYNMTTGSAYRHLPNKESASDQLDFPDTDNYQKALNKRDPSYRHPNLSFAGTPIAHFCVESSAALQ